LREIKKHRNLVAEASVIERRFQDIPSSRVSDLLNLDSPLIENPIFHVELHRAKIYQYAKLSRLNGKVSRKIEDKKLFFDNSDEEILAELVKEGTINEKQKQDLQLVISLAKLTGDNLPFIQTLKTDDLNSVRDFIKWDKADWQKLITEEKIPLPPGTTIESYAENLLFNMEKTYPSHSLLSRLTDRNQTSSVIDLLDSVNSLLQNNPTLVDSDRNVVGRRTRTGLGANSSPQIELRGIGAIAQKKLCQGRERVRINCNYFIQCLTKISLEDNLLFHWMRRWFSNSKAG